MEFNGVWLWLIVGLILMASELTVPGFWIIFFGISALCTAAIKWFMPCFCFPYSVLFFTFFGICLLFLSRRCFPQFFSSKNNTDTSDKHIETDDMPGSQAIVTVAITAQRPGKVDFRGTSWNAKSDKDIAVGEMVTIVSRSNITLIVK